MLSDPQSVTLATVAQSLPAINRGNLTSTYRKADGSVTLTISHQPTAKGRIRHMTRLDIDYIAPDPFTSANTEYTVSTYLVIDRPAVGLTQTQCRNVAEALVDFLTDGNLDKILAQES